VVWHRTEVDGVPAYWAESDDDERGVFLTFRVGVADEQLAFRGITHVVEHLAMYSVGGPVHASNGQVDAVTTVFGTLGDTDIAGFVTGICRALRALPFERLEVENQILRTEADSRAPALTAPLMLWRYGAATYGLPAYDEFGVGRHTPDQITAWVERWFTRRNAVLVFAGGPPPAGLTIDLPEGERIAPPTPSSALPRTPAYFCQPANVVAMSALVDRSTEAQVYAMLLSTRLQRSLRQEAGLSYSPATSYDPRDGHTAHITAFADGLPENHDKLLPAFLRELELLAERPAAPEEITDVVARIRTSRRRSPALGTAYGNALRELLGAERLTSAEVDARLDSVDPETLRRTAGQALESALVMVPGARPPTGRYREAPQSSVGVVDGQVSRSADAPSNAARLIVGTEGVSMVRGPRYLTVRFRECEAMLAWPDGARKLIGRDGFFLTVEPTLWTHGASLPARLDAGVPAERVVPMPQRRAEDIPTPKTSRYERVRARFKHR
jgi:zinc protease